MIPTKQIDWIKVIYLSMAILFAVLWLRGCEATKPQIVNVKVPEVKGSFKAQKPVNHPVNIPLILTNYVKNKKVDTSNENEENLQKLIAENDSLKLAFSKEKDSLKKNLLFEKAIQLNKFNTKFEDENIVLNIDGIVQGEVKEVTPSYNIKPRELDVPVKCKESVFRVLGGGELGLPRDLSKVPLKGNLMFQNHKGNIISIGYDNSQNIWVGYHFSIFERKR